VAYAVVFTLPTSPFARNFFRVDNKEEEFKTRWDTSPPPTKKVAKLSTVDDTTAFGEIRELGGMSFH